VDKPESLGVVAGVPPEAKGGSILSSYGIQNSFVDLLFPETVTTCRSLTTEDKAKQELQRKAAVQKIQNWWKCGKPWSKRFGKGILLMLPKDISDVKSVFHPTSSAIF